jgi:hypothetical protein
LLPQILAAAAFGAALFGAPFPEARVALDSPGGEALEPGTTVSVHWKGLPADAEELELLLEIGGGVRLRITEELDPDSGSYAWTVPNLSLPRARVVLRLNRKGRELEAGVSEPFRIRRTPDSAAPALGLRAGELWIWGDPHPSSRSVLAGRAKLSGTARKRMKALRRETPVGLRCASDGSLEPTDRGRPLDRGLSSSLRRFGSREPGAAPPSFPRRI